MKSKEPFNILIADDDEDDFVLLVDAFKESGFRCPLYLVEDGEELMDYLRRKGKYSDASMSPWPNLILLDLNMPRKDGREALREIKDDPDLRAIPVVIITTSEDETDKLMGREFGCSFVTKPDSFEKLVVIIKAIGMEWLVA